MWRPSDWKNPYKDKPKSGSFEFQVFERGADAMLEALWADGIDIKKLKNSHELKILLDMVTVSLLEKGRWIFIPEEIDG